MSDDGWIPVTDTWTFASADAPTFTITVPGDQTGVYSVGCRLKLTQTTVRYFIVTAVSFASGTTTVTLYGGTDYTLDNAAISSPSYSRVKAPLGFPLDPAKWTVTVTDATNAAQAAPVANTWYNLGAITVSMPVGAWDTRYHAALEGVSDPAASTTYAIVNARATLSTSASAESDNDFTAFLRIAPAAGVTSEFAGVSLTREKLVVATAKTPWYLLAMAFNVTEQGIAFRGDRARTRIELVCAYL